MSERYAISLTSIPPRLPRIGPVLESLLSQRPAPEAVYLCLPRIWTRFGGEMDDFNAPDGLVIHRSDVDLGPCMKATEFCVHKPISVSKLIYCDDDWIYPQGWARALLRGSRADCAVAASGFRVARLKRHGHGDGTDLVEIAQGFGGVCIDPTWFDLPDIVPPPEARLADDIWLSGQLARQGIGIRLCADARRGLRPAFDDPHGLQDVVQEGLSRAEVNRAALDALTRRYGIWPPV